MSDNSDNVIDDFVLPERVAGPPPRKRRRSTVLSADDIVMMRRMFQALQKYTYIWQIPIGKRGPMRPNLIEWGEIAKAATGDYNDVAKVKDWYKRTKKSIRYRITNGINKCHISREALEADGEEALQTFYSYYHNYVLWPDVEYLTKYFIYQELDVDLDGIFTQQEDHLLSTNEATAQGTAAGCNELLRGVAGFEIGLRCHELSPVARVSQTVAPQVEGTDQNPSCQTFDQNQIQGGDLTSVMLDIKQEIFDTDMANQPEDDAYDTSALQNDASAAAINNIKQEMNDNGTPRGNSLIYSHPLKHLDPTNKETCPPPQPEQFGITQEEMDKRIELFKTFQQYVEDKVQQRSTEEIIEFHRQFNKVSSLVSVSASIGKSADEIAEQVERMLIC